jgi:hypothetical protein
LRRPDTVRTLVVIGTNYCVDERSLAEVNSIDADVIERDYPDFAARFAGQHDGGKHAGYWKELLARIVDNNGPTRRGRPPISAKSAAPPC